MSFGVHQMRMFGTSAWGEHPLSPSSPSPTKLPWTSGAGGLTDEALEAMLKERGKKGEEGGDQTAASGHEREDRTIEEKVMMTMIFLRHSFFVCGTRAREGGQHVRRCTNYCAKAARGYLGGRQADVFVFLSTRFAALVAQIMRWDDNCEGWLHVASAIKQLLQCKSSPFDRCYASRTLSRISSIQHTCAALLCTPTILASVCACLDAACGDFAANERAVELSSDSGGSGSAGNEQEGGGGREKPKVGSSSRGSDDDGNRGGREREWWEVGGGQDGGLVQGLHQQCILHCTYILFCCARTGCEESEIVVAMGGIPALLMTASLKGSSSRILEMSVMGLSMLAQHPPCAHAVRKVKAVPVLAAICSYQLRRFRTLRQRHQGKDRRVEAHLDRMMGVSLRVAVSTAAAVMLSAEDADQAARSIDMELMGHVTSGLKSYLVKVSRVKSSLPSDE